MRTQPTIAADRRGVMGRLGLVAGLLISGYLIWMAAPQRPVSNAGEDHISITKVVDGNNANSVPTLAIEEIRVGDLVLAQDPATGRKEYRRVREIFRRTSDHLRIVTIGAADDGTTQTLKTTDEHPFWVPDQGWTNAADLEPGDKILQHDGQICNVESSTYEPHPKGVTVFNFETEDFHTYFVAANGQRGPPVLVHNCNGGPCFVAGTIVNTEHGPSAIEDIVEGTKVWAYCHQTHRWQLQPVTNTFVHNYTGDIISVHTANEVIEATGNHPFWVVQGDRLNSRPFPEHLPQNEVFEGESGRWVDARNLQAGDTLLSRTRQEQQVQRIEHRQESTTVFNFEVATLHTYNVGTIGLLVHNKPDMGGTAPPNLTPDGAGRRGAFRQAKADAGIPRSQQPSKTRVVPDRQRPGQTVKEFDFAVPKPGGGSRRVTLQEHIQGHSYGPNNPQNRGRHLNGPHNKHYDY